MDGLPCKTCLHDIYLPPIEKIIKWPLFENLISGLALLRINYVFSSLPIKLVLASLDNKQFTNSETLLFLENIDGKLLFRLQKCIFIFKLGLALENIMLNTLNHQFVTFFNGLNHKMSKKCGQKSNSREIFFHSFFLCLLSNWVMKSSLTGALTLVWCSIVQLSRTNQPGSTTFKYFHIDPFSLLLSPHSSSFLLICCFTFNCRIDTRTTFKRELLSEDSDLIPKPTWKR